MHSHIANFTSKQVVHSHPHISNANASPHHARSSHADARQLNKLKNPANDATLLKGALVTHGFQVTLERFLCCCANVDESTPYAPKCVRALFPAFFPGECCRDVGVRMESLGMFASGFVPLNVTRMDIDMFTEYFCSANFGVTCAIRKRHEEKRASIVSTAL